LEVAVSLAKLKTAGACLKDGKVRRTIEEEVVWKCMESMGPTLKILKPR
jgi:hypothetical protein